MGSGERAGDRAARPQVPSWRLSLLQKMRAWKICEQKMQGHGPDHGAERTGSERFRTSQFAVELFLDSPHP